MGPVGELPGTRRFKPPVHRVTSPAAMIAWTATAPVAVPTAIRERAAGGGLRRPPSRVASLARSRLEAAPTDTGPYPLTPLNPS